MAERRAPASMLWLAWLSAVSLLVAVVSGVTIYLESRQVSRTQAEASTGGHVDAGKVTIQSLGCGACHMIPGVAGANGKVGPDLNHVAQRAAIAGSLPNDPETMVRWLLHPRQLRPGSGMPEMGLTEPQARDIAAYLYANG